MPSRSSALITSVLVLIILAGCQKPAEEKKDEKTDASEQQASPDAKPTQEATQAPTENPVSMAAVETLLADMKFCLDKDQSPEATFFCACKSDVTLSKLAPPADLEAHCRQVTDANVGLIGKPGEEQAKSLFVTGAKDVPVSSGLIFALTVPCMLEAKKSDDPTKMESCFCFAHEAINRLWQPVTSNGEQARLMDKVVQDVLASNRCRPK
ncbi:MAG: hypothetical protein AUK47_09930 [Deltaproteobacteria bacterium CG2_30_63_29]|nr:MAG: hypothetical protein AUK47_09930 [Deltaproteobacteria bacterium CG2_30_63_29]PJB48062.1 MAG: hypothetical protein CO108_03070 [Deltaproteobacteria bacterium CG_4_9_14_3_um_filter_63_12]